MVNIIKQEIVIEESLKKKLELICEFSNTNIQIINGKVKHLLETNLQFVEPTEYIITYPTTLTILEYKVNEISNKPFYIKEHNEKYNLKEIK